MTFAERYPALFHVADRAALGGIRQHGLLSARRLAERHGADTALLRQNRTRYAELAPGVALRRQGMRDGPLRPRLASSITTEDWRWFINGFVFLYPTQPLAEALLRSEPDRDQVVLAFDTAAVIGAGVQLYTCRFNNGYMDRSPVASARRRRYDDYRPTADWFGAETVKEVAAFDAIPPDVTSAVISRA